MATLKEFLTTCEPNRQQPRPSEVLDQLVKALQDALVSEPLDLVEVAAEHVNLDKEGLRGFLRSAIRAA